MLAACNICLLRTIYYTHIKIIQQARKLILTLTFKPQTHLACGSVLVCKRVCVHVCVCVFVWCVCVCVGGCVCVNMDVAKFSCTPSPLEESEVGS